MTNVIAALETELEALEAQPGASISLRRERLAILTS